MTGAQPRRMLLVSGSLRRGSTNAAVVATAQEVMPEGWSGVVYAGLRDLPHFDPDDDTDPLPASVTATRTAFVDAEAVLFSTPEYAGALPGSFKNLLDWTIGGSSLVGQRVGWINASSSPTGARGAHESLRTVLGYAGAEIVDDACRHVPVPRDAIDAGGVITDPGLRRQVGACVGALADAHDHPVHD